MHTNRVIYRHDQLRDPKQHRHLPTARRQCSSNHQLNGLVNKRSTTYLHLQRNRIKEMMHGCVVVIVSIFSETALYSSLNFLKQRSFSTIVALILILSNISLFSIWIARALFDPFLVLGTVPIRIGHRACIHYSHHAVW